MRQRDETELSHRAQGHDVREYDGGSETRFFCKTCGATWSQMRVSEYEREVAQEDSDEQA